MTTNTWDPAKYQHNAGFVAQLGVPVLDLLGDIRGQRVLDLGCGDGVLTLKLVEAGAQVVGVDASPQMVAGATAQGLEAYVMDAQHLTFRDEFDAVFTNATLHWVPNHPLCLHGVFSALHAGGIFAGEFGGYGNVAAICTALYATLERHGYPAETRFHWNFPSVRQFESDLVAAGFGQIEAHLIPRPTPLPTGVRGWLQTFANPMFAGIPTDQHDALLDETVVLLRNTLVNEYEEWHADYVRLRFRAVKV
jgi:SAM-dependent methyltransferase